MRWNTLGTFVLLLGSICWCHSMETQDHAPSSDKTYHFPSASLTIAGDLKDVKLKGTIAQLVRALQPSPKPKEEEPEPKPKATNGSGGTKKIISPSQLITKHTLSAQGKKLYYGDPVPESINVSSQSVSVKVSDRNTTGNKKSRHLAAYIGNRPSAVRIVEGARVPDDEEDKYYTWRNARVIKGFLVPKGRAANPKKKRQVIITDPQQYLLAAAAAQAQGATTIIDASNLQQPNQGNSNNGQPRTSVFYAQENHHSQGPAATSTGGGSVFANDPNQQRSHPHVVYPNQHQTHQTTNNNNGQTGAFAYSQQNPHSMYVLQDGANNAFNANNQYNGNPGSAASSSAAHLSQQHHQQQAQLTQQQAQAQFFSRSGEASTVSGIALASAQNSQQQNHHGSQAQNLQQQQQQQQQQQPLSAAIKQQQYQASLDTQAIQAAVEAVQQLEAQQQVAAALAAAGVSHQQSPSSGQQPGQLPGIQQQQQQHNQQHLLAQQSAPTQTVVLPGPGAATLLSGGATAQEILAATAAATNGQVTAQYIQIQPSQEQSILQLQQPSQQQQQFPAPNQFAERQNYQSGSTPSQFVIQSQTFSSGAGGQTFTVPIPVPVEQAIASQHHQQQQQSHHHQQQQHPQSYNQQQQQQAPRHHQNQNHHGSGNSQQFNNHQNQYQQYPGNNQNSNNRQLQNNHNGHNGQNQQSITDRMKQAFNQNFNRKTLESVERNAVVPALASTGIFLGLSALAAGWYLSKNNREVGIVRRSSKFSKKSGSLQPSSSTSGASLEPKDKEEGANSRTRRDLASMVTPQAYNPHGPPEVDQATFFQSIIQQSLEKTQKDYEDQPVYQQNQDNNVGNSDGPIGYHRAEPEPERHAPPPPLPPPSRHRSNRYNRYNDRPSKYRDDDYYDSSANSRVSKSQQIQEKSGWSVHSAKNFARVAIPAVVLTGAALGICAVIFGWYISGDNREIAFLESPSTQSIGHRRKRSLFGSSTSSTAWSDGWLIRTLKAIHGNPYDNMPAPTAKSFVPYPYFLDKDSSKTSTLEFKVSNNGLAGVIAGGAVLAVVALGLINSFAEPSSRNLKTARYNHLLTNSAAAIAFANNNGKSIGGSSTNPLTHLRSPRRMDDGENNLDHHVSNPSFFESIISSLEASGDTIMNKLHELGSTSHWHQSSCTKRILCQVIASQGDDTVRLMEKKMASVIKMLPDSVSSSINKNYSDVLSAIYKRDCSAFTCATHKQLSQKSSENKSKSVKSSAPSSSHPIKKQENVEKSSLKIEQTVTNHHR